MLARALLAAYLVCLGACRGWHQRTDFSYVRPDPGGCSCVLILNFTNLSNIENGGEQAASLIADALGADSRFHVFRLADFARLFASDEVFMPSTELGLDIARLVGVDAVLSGTVGGTWEVGMPSSMLWIEARLLAAVDGDPVWLATKIVRPSALPAGATADDALRGAGQTMVDGLVDDLRPRRTTVRTACLNEAIRNALAARESPAATLSPPVPSAPEKTEPEPAKTEPAPAKTESVVSAEAPSKPVAAEMSGPASEILARLREGQAVILPGVLLGQSSPLLAVDEAQVAAHGEVMRAHPELRVEVRVHTDNSASPDDSLRLSERQAKDLARRLAKSWRIDPSRLEAKGMGASQPIQPNISRRGREANRRADIIIVPTQ